MLNTHSRKMLEIAGRAVGDLGSIADSALQFVLGQMNPDGGFKDRAGKSDLYYTVFGIKCLIVLGHPLPETRIKNYLRSFGAGSELDLMHLACLAGCWTWFPREDMDENVRGGIIGKIKKYRCPNGGYASRVGGGNGTLYGCYLAHTTYQDLGIEMPDSRGILKILEQVKAADGGYANEAGMEQGTTTSTAGVILMRLDFGQPEIKEPADWILCRRHPEGGFFASPDAPIPDLVSTATALYALRLAGQPLAGVRDSCTTYVGSLWHESGGFSAHWLDETADCEHTFDAFLSLGCLIGD